MLPSRSRFSDLLDSDQDQTPSEVNSDESEYETSDISVADENEDETLSEAVEPEPVSSRTDISAILTYVGVGAMGVGTVATYLIAHYNLGYDEGMAIELNDIAQTMWNSTVVPAAPYMEPGVYTCSTYLNYGNQGETWTNINDFPCSALVTGEGYFPMMTPDFSRDCFPEYLKYCASSLYCQIAINSDRLALNVSRFMLGATVVTGLLEYTNRLRPSDFLRNLTPTVINGFQTAQNTFGSAKRSLFSLFNRSSNNESRRLASDEETSNNSSYRRYGTRS